jgi:hypothetical protein
MSMSLTTETQVSQGATEDEVYDAASVDAHLVQRKGVSFLLVAAVDTSGRLAAVADDSDHDDKS